MTDKGKRPAKTRRARKPQDKNLKQIPVSFGAYREELDRWKQRASALDRTLSWWIRHRLLAMDEMDGDLSPAPASAVDANETPVTQ